MQEREIVTALTNHFRQAGFKILPDEIQAYKSEYSAKEEVIPEPSYSSQSASIRY